MSYQWAKIANGIDLATSKEIPDAGDFWIDPKTNNGKIGDGKTPMFELPWVTLGVDLSTEPPRKYKMPDHVKRFIEANIDTIERCDYDRLYSYIVTEQLKRDVTIALLEADLNPKPYLTTVPRCIQDLLLDLPPYDKVDDVDDKLYTYDCELYTKAEVDAKFETVKQQIARACGIPGRILNGGGLN